MTRTNNDKHHKQVMKNSLLRPALSIRLGRPSRGQAAVGARLILGHAVAAQVSNPNDQMASPTAATAEAANLRNIRIFSAQGVKVKQKRPKAMGHTLSGSHA